MTDLLTIEGLRPLGFPDERVGAGEHDRHSTVQNGVTVAGALVRIVIPPVQLILTNVYTVRFHSSLTTVLDEQLFTWVDGLAGVDLGRGLDWTLPKPLKTLDKVGLLLRNCMGYPVSLQGATAWFRP